MAKQDNDADISTGETLRQSKSRGARQNSRAGKGHSQERGSALTPSGSTWAQVKRDWQTGAFTLRGLSSAHMVPLNTLTYRMKRDEKNGAPWGDRPLASAVTAVLPGFVVDADARDVSVEQVLADIEEREPDADTVHKERASAVAQRKAVILRGHRQIAAECHALYTKAAFLLSEYMQGRQASAFVKASNEKGEQILLPLRLVSAQHGIMDGLDKLVKIAERTIKIEREANALQGVDGDGNPIKATGLSTNALAHLTDEEIVRKTEELAASLTVPGRLTPVPSELDLSFRA